MYAQETEVSMSKSTSNSQVEARIREAGERAAAEAEERRKTAAKAELPPEVDGQKGPEPTRFGDWEKKGLISDF
jgi:hypothetical protein